LPTFFKFSQEGECGLLDTENVTGAKPKKLWIVRIPNDVSDAIEAAAPQSSMGTLTMEGVGKSCTRSISLKPFHPSFPPTNYELMPVNRSESESDGNSGKLYGFSVSKDKTNVKLEGTASSQFVLKPRLGNLYTEYLKKRNHMEAMAKSEKKVKILDDDEEDIIGAPSTFIPTKIYRNAEEAAAQALGEGGGGGGSSKSGKKNGGVELSASELQADLFTLFEKHEKIWIQDLKNQLQCSDAQLRKLLSDICDKEKVGAKVYYKLNANYRRK
jgi:hypothetical protein